MTLGQMFRLMIEVGRRADWRDEATFEAQLAARRAEYEALGEAERRFFDTERLWNPFGCSRICSGEPDMEVRGMVVGINPSLAAVLYAERLRDGGLPVDALLTHHGMPPAGTIYDDINNTHYHVLRDFGVPEDTARSVVQEAINGYYRRMVGEPTALEQNTDLSCCWSWRSSPSPPAGASRHASRPALPIHRRARSTWTCSEAYASTTRNWGRCWKPGTCRRSSGSTTGGA